MKTFNRSGSVGLVATILLLLSAVGCKGGGTTTPGTDSTGGSGGSSTTAFVLSGTATYDAVPALDNVTEGGVRLGYTMAVAKPIRRATVQAIRSGVAVAETVTNDYGEFILDVPPGTAVYLRVRAEMQSNGYYSDEGLSFCDGASWDVKVVDNTDYQALYVLDGSTNYSGGRSGIAIHAPLSRSAGYYRDRSSAPFAILDTVISDIELVCQARPDAYFPKLRMNWSVDNTNESGQVSWGQIGTTYYTIENGISNIYILGDEDVDTDEYDDHVIAHELAHYLENELFRSDSVGGSHSSRDTLDPRVAFGEGFGNAVSAMALWDPIYVDTNGMNQAGGFMLRMDTPPVGDNSGIYSEKSIQYFLWKLYENRAAVANASAFDRIYDILANYQTTSPALTTVLTFASYYNEAYGGDAEDLMNLWEIDLDTPYDALCPGSCNGVSDYADPFDFDNDIGNWYSGYRYYEQDTGYSYDENFWRIYRELQYGRNYRNGHDQTDWANYSSPRNKFGNNRYYVYIAPTSGTRTISVDRLAGFASCLTDYLDMYVYDRGISVGADYSSSGCPSVTIDVTAGEAYVMVLRGYAAELSGWDVTVY